MRFSPCIGRWIIPAAHCFRIARPAHGTGKKIEDRIQELLQRAEGFFAIILWVSNLKRLDASLPAGMIDGALKAMVQRATASTGSHTQGSQGAQAMIGRWASDQFVMLLDVDTTVGLAISKDLAQRLSSRYAIQYEGISHQVTLHVATGVVDHAAGGDHRKLRARLEQITGVALGL
jgi:GGDEF domain-containing protein